MFARGEDTRRRRPRRRAGRRSLAAPLSAAIRPSSAARSAQRRAATRSWASLPASARIRDRRRLDPARHRYHDERRGDFLHVVGRLKDGASARAGAGRVDGGRAAPPRSAYPERTPIGAWRCCRSGRPWSVRCGRRSCCSWARSASVLLIACANVANLMLARAAAREHEIVSARRSAPRGAACSAAAHRERAALRSAAGALGLVSPSGACRALGRSGRARCRARGDRRRRARARFALVLSVVTGLLFGWRPPRGSAPTLSGGAARGRPRGRRRRAGRNLRGAGARRSGARVRAPGRGGTARPELRPLLRVEPGFRTEGLFTARLLLPRSATGRRRQAAFSRRLSRGWRPAGGPLGGGRVRRAARRQPAVRGFVSGAAHATAGTVQASSCSPATPDYFRTLGIPLVRGRLFGASDRADAPPVALVNQAAAAAISAGRSPIGARISFDEPSDSAALWMTVVGVVGDVRHEGLGEPPYPQIYLPVAQARTLDGAGRATDVRRSADTAPSDAARDGHARPDLALSELSTMEQRIAATARPRSAQSCSALRRARAAARRARHLRRGVLRRAAADPRAGHPHGARRRQRAVLRMVVRQGMAPVDAVKEIVNGGRRRLVGASARVLRTTAVPGRSVRSRLHPPSRVTLFLGGAALLACYLPARRAARADPVTALRAE